MTDLWVFGYGSLMWRPGFPYVESVPARVHGAHRSLCVYSHVHRGTEDRPGLVLGLDRGGSCRGVAFRVAPADADAALAQLRARELVTNVYREVMAPVRLEDGSGRAVEAVVYLVDRGHSQYAGTLPREAVLAIVGRGHGHSGSNRDYVLNTVAHLAGLGISDAELQWLAGCLRAEDPPRAPVGLSGGDPGGAAPEQVAEDGLPLDRGRGEQVDEGDQSGIGGKVGR